MAFKSFLKGDFLPTSMTGDLVPKSSAAIAILLVSTSCITSTTLGYDGSMMNGLNILPSYTNYFSLDTATLSLNSAAMSMGGCLSVLYCKVPDILGRKPALFWAAVITLIGIVLQTAAQNVAMFVIARIIVGLGNGCSGLAGPVYVAEALPLNWRGWGLGVFYCFWYVGGLIAAGVTYGTARMDSTWAWRLPSVLQTIFGIVCIVILPFVPESPRWLAFQGRKEEAFAVIAQSHANGDHEDPRVLAVYKEIIDTQAWEREFGVTLSLTQLFKTPSARKRMLLSLSVAAFVGLCGNAIVSYYLGTMLDNAGITDTTTQLQINIILNAWCLVVSLVGTYSVDFVGRKPLAMLSTLGCAIFIYMVGALTKTYGESTNKSGTYGTVACIFLFQGIYSFGWTPLTVMYPPEVMNYPIRANGMGLYQFLTSGTGLLTTFTMPFALDAIGWKMYMINGTWDIFQLFFIWYFWIETKGKTLEEIDEKFDGVKHSDVPDVEDIMKNKLKVDLGSILDGVDPTRHNQSSTPITELKTVEEVAIKEQ